MINCTNKVKNPMAMVITVLWIIASLVLILGGLALGVFVALELGFDPERDRLATGVTVFITGVIGWLGFRYITNLMARCVWEDAHG